MKNLLRVFFLLIVLLETAGAFGLPFPNKDFTWVGLLVTIGFAWIVLEVFNFSALVWIASLFMVLLDGVSDIYGLYSKYYPWDKIVHFCGGALIAIAALELTTRVLKGGHVSARKLKTFTSLSVMYAVVFVGFLYEFWEYLVDRIQYGYPKSLVSAYNSVEDQLFNILGGIIVLLIYYFWRKNKKESV